jgi:hypothetical protein
MTELERSKKAPGGRELFCGAMRCARLPEIPARSGKNDAKLRTGDRNTETVRL